MLTAATLPDFGLNLDADFHSKVILSVIVLVGVWLARVLILRMVWRSTTNHKVRYRWKRALSYAAPACLFLFVALVWINAFRHVSTFLGLLSAGIAIALKDLLENMAGWLFIVIRKPFAVGDRVQIGDDRGDIIDIRLFQFTILEIGNRIDAEQSTGRIIHIPNGRVFTTPQANYDQGFRYIWNEVRVRLTFDSNWQRAREILLEVLNRYGGDVVLDAEQGLNEASKMYYVHYQHLTPIVYIALMEDGITLTGRYLCEPRRIRSTESAIWEDLLTAYATHNDIRWAYPTRRLVGYGD